MLKLKKIAITGNPGAGKTTVCEILKRKNYTVVNSDEIVHELLSSHPKVIKEITDLFGQEIVKDKHISREELAKHAFENPEKWKTLEKIIHPYVFNEIEKCFQKIQKNRQNSFFFVEIPLLFETGKEKDFDYVITVTADQEIRKKRWEIKHPHTDHGKRESRFIQQTSKEKHSDFIIKNNQGFQQLEEQVEQMLFLLKKN